MNDFDYEYLKALMQDAATKRQHFPFSPPDETDATVTYVSSKLKIHWPGQIGSLDFCHQTQTYHVEEKNSLRKNTQNYFRIVRRDAKILRIDTFVHGRCDVILLMHYEGNKRYAFPFSKTGGFYPTYIQVQTYDSQGEVMEDYMVNNVQIVYSTYRKCTDDSVQRRYINYIPKGHDPIVWIEEGFYTLGEPLTYTMTDNLNMNMESKPSCP